MQQAIPALHAARKLNENVLLDFAEAHKYEETVAALSAMSGDRYDPIPIVGKMIRLHWTTVRALILLRLGPNRVVSQADLKGARLNFARLMPSTVERAVSFCKTCHAAWLRPDWPTKHSLVILMSRRDTAPAGRMRC